MTEYVKEFDKWNTSKKNTDIKVVGKVFYFHQREVWWCAIGVNVGVEVDGKNNDFERPVLIIKKFNREMFWGIPLTTKERPHLLLVEHEKGTSYANLSQLRVMSTKRLLRKIGMIADESFKEVLVKLGESLTIEPHHKDGALGGRSH